MEPKKIDIVYADSLTPEDITPDDGMNQSYNPEYLHKYLSNLTCFNIEFNTLSEKLSVERYLEHIGIEYHCSYMISGIIVIKEKSIFSYKQLGEKDCLVECFKANEIIDMMKKLKIY